MSEEVPDIYADQFAMSINPYGVVMSFLVAGHPTGPGKSLPPKQVLILRMSLEHAKAQAQIMHRELKRYEDNVIKCPIPLPKEPPKEVAQP